MTPVNSKNKTTRSAGKILTVFIIIIAILLMTLTASSIFYLQKEREERVTVEDVLQKKEAELVKLGEEIKEAKKQNFVLEEKNKEADEKINSLLDDLELKEGLREELKKENAALQEQAGKEIKAQEKLKEQVAQGLKEAEEKIAALEARLKEEITLKETLQQQLVGGNHAAIAPLTRDQEVAAQTELNRQQFEDETKVPPPPSYELPESVPPSPVDLEKIVVIPESLPDGRIISIDADTEFVIINLGSKDGVVLGNVMSVYRGKDYLGDIKVTRVQPKMSAADLIPPFTSRLARRNDQVVVKK